MKKIKFSVKNKMLTSFIFVIIIMALVSGYSYYEINSMQKSYERIIQTNLVYLISFQDLQKSIITEIDLVKNYALTKDNTMLEQIKQLNLQNKAALTEISSHPLTSEKNFDVETMITMFDNYTKDEQEMVKAVEQDKLHVFLAYNDKKFAEAIDGRVNLILSKIKEDVKLQRDLLRQEVAKNKNFLISANFITLLITIAIAILISRKISKPVKGLSNYANLLADGDFTNSIEIFRSRDEIGELSISFYELHKKIKEFIRQIQQNSEQVAQTSLQISVSAEQTAKSFEQITIATQEISANSENQISKVNESTESVIFFRNGISSIEKNANEAADSASHASISANTGKEIVKNAINQMQSIGQTVDNSVLMVTQLNQQSEKIGEFSNLITDIAEQTNLLALNAAIEAARAGEQGKGFAVVADEVRKLAEQTANAAKNIVETITLIQQETATVVKTMSNGNFEVKKGIEVINQVDEAFKQILQTILNVSSSSNNTKQSVKELADYVNSIIEGFTEMQAGIEANAAHTQNMAATQQEQNAAVEEISSSIEDLSMMAGELKELLGKFKI